MKLFRLPFGGLIARLTPSRWVRFCVFLGGVSLSCSELWAQPNPDTLWTRSYPYDFCFAMVQASEGGFLIAGSNFTDAFRWDARLLKIDEVGNLEWTRSYGVSELTESFSDLVTTENGYFAVGYRYGIPILQYPQLYAARFDSEGDTLWTYAYGCFRSTYGGTALVNRDGNFVVAGETYCTADTEGTNPIIQCIDDSGELLWTRQYAIPASITSSTLADDGGYYFLGTWGDLDRDNSIPVILIRTDENGDTLWTHLYVEDSIARGTAIEMIADGSLYVAGFVREARGEPANAIVLHVSSSGQPIWTSRLGASTNTTFAYDIEATEEGCVVFGNTAIAGISRADYCLFGLDSSGDSLWMRTYGGAIDDFCTAGLVLPDHGYLLCGYGQGIYVVKTGPDILETSEGGVGVMANSIHITCFPNPFNPTTEITFSLPQETEITLRVFDVVGREVAVLVHGWMSAGEHSVTFDGRELAAGVYFYRMEAGEGFETRKMLLLK